MSAGSQASDERALAPRFPRVRRGLARGDLARQAERVQGVYEVGGHPTLFDPAFTGQSVPEAVLRHEEVHSDLTLHTSHGMLTAILSEYNKVSPARSSLAVCEETQWSVQELGATYAELAFIQRVAPADFSACIHALPSATRHCAPYREAFDFGNWLLPLDDDARHERSDPRTLVIGTLCTCSMSTSCLRQLARADFEDDSFAAWIADNAPDARLEEIGVAVGPTVFLQMARRVSDRLKQSRLTPRFLREVFEELSGVMLACVPRLTAEPLQELSEQALAAVRQLRRTCPEFTFEVTEYLRPKGPLFAESPEKRKLIEEQFRFDDLSAGS